MLSDLHLLPRQVCFFRPPTSHAQQVHLSSRLRTSTMPVENMQVCVCTICICIYIYRKIYTYIYIYTRTYRNILMHVQHIHVCVRACVRACVGACVRAGVRACVHAGSAVVRVWRRAGVRACVDVGMYDSMYAFMHVYMYIHTRIYIHMHALNRLVATAQRCHLDPWALTPSRGLQRALCLVRISSIMEKYSLTGVPL